MANPPITVGELTDVPAPESAINAQFHQEVAHRIIHRFTTLAQMNAWAAGNGSMAYCAEVSDHFVRQGGAWHELAMISNVYERALGIIDRKFSTENQTAPGNATTPVTNCSITFNADPGRWYRTAGAMPHALTPTGSVLPITRLSIRDAVNNIHEVSAQHPVPNAFSMSLSIVESGLSGAITRRLVVATGSASTLQMYDPSPPTAASRAPWISVEDLGAV